MRVTRGVFRKTPRRPDVHLPAKPKQSWSMPLHRRPNLLPRPSHRILQPLGDGDQESVDIGNATGRLRAFFTELAKRFRRIPLDGSNRSLSRLAIDGGKGRGKLAEAAREQLDRNQGKGEIAFGVRVRF